MENDGNVDFTNKTGVLRSSIHAPMASNGYSLKFKHECRISTMDSFSLGCWENFGGNRQPNSNIRINHFVGVARLPRTKSTRNIVALQTGLSSASGVPDIHLLQVVKIAIWGNIEFVKISWFSDKSWNSSNVSSPFFTYPRRPRPSGINSRSDRICRTSSSTEASKVKVYP